MDTKLLNRVRALLAKAENTEFPQEAETLTAKAHELMARHGIEQAHLAAQGRVNDEIKVLRVDMTGSYTTRKAQLLSAIAAACRCKSIRYSAPKSSITIYAMVIGYQADLDRVELLYTSLLLQAAGQIRHQRPGHLDGSSVVAYRSAWFAGFASEVGRRLRQIEADAITTATAQGAQYGPKSTELVLVDRMAKVEQAYDEHFPDAKTAKPRSVNRDGFYAGRDAGQRADLGQTRVGGARTAIR